MMMTEKIILKVTAFIVKNDANTPELLLFRHPYAGVQIPAGTVNPGESPEDAVLREVREETGLKRIRIVKFLGEHEDHLPEDQKIILKNTKVYARPDASSFDWAYLRPGIAVKTKRRTNDFCQIIYQEFDQVPDSTYETMVIKGWVPEDVLTGTSKRFFYQVSCKDRSEERWTQSADNHTFILFWAPLSDIPEIIPPQDSWLVFLRKVYPQFLKRR